MQLNLYKIFGRLFGMAKTDFMTPIISNDLDSANLKTMFEKLGGRLASPEYQGELTALTNDLTLTIGPEKSDLDDITATSLLQSKVVLENMTHGEPCMLFLTQSFPTSSSSKSQRKTLLTFMLSMG
jgi:hypothetical protein